MTLTEFIYMGLPLMIGLSIEDVAKVYENAKRHYEHPARFSRSCTRALVLQIVLVLLCFCGLRGALSDAGVRGSH